MLARVAKATMFVAAGALLFALVCPLAATPMPVGKVKRISDAVTPATIPLPVILTTSLLEGPPTVPGSPEALVSDIPDLICVRTC